MAQNLAQPSRRYIREGPLTVIRGTNQKKEGYCFLFNDLLVVARKHKVKGECSPPFARAV